MTGRVAGKVAFVSGAASGIGRASALLLAGEGAQLALADVDAAGLQAVAREIGPAALPLPMDVTQAEAWDVAIKQTVARFGKLDVLAHCAGMSLNKNIEDTSYEDWRRVHALNLDSIFLGTKAAIPELRRAGMASIIMVSSSSGLRGKPDLAAYCSSKGGVRLLSRSVALHLAREGGRIRCNAVFPGTVDTPMVRRSFGVAPDDPEAWAKVLTRVSGIPVGHIGEAVDIAYMILYLASDESKYVTGAELVVDGGRTA